MFLEKYIPQKLIFILLNQNLEFLDHIILVNK